MKRALIIGNGEEVNKDIIESLYPAYVICADGGLERAEKYGLIPDIIIGDFDSVDLSLLDRYREHQVDIEKFPSEKDFTDMELAIECAISKGYKNIVLTGATGTRLDHTFANFMLIEKYHKIGVDLTIIDNNNELKIISPDGDLIIDNKEGYYISLIPLTDCIQGLSLEGFKYPLNKVSVQRGSTLCISNQLIGSKGRITLNKGTAIVFISKD